MSAPDPKTFRDLIDTLVYHLGGASDEKNQTQIRQAIRNAYRDLTTGRSWSYYWAHGRLEFSVPYSTGTAQYTQSTRVFTITGGTIPTNVDNYWGVKIGRVLARVQSRTDNTNLVLDPVVNFEADLAAGQTYTLFQDTYPLPIDFKAMCSPRGEANWWVSNYISPEDFMFSQRSFAGISNSGQPMAYTIAGDPNVINGYAIFLWPWPGVAQTYDYMYQRYPRPLLRTGYADADTTGTITATGGTSTITGSGTSWTSAMVGSVMRLGTSTTKVPTGIEGNNPYQEQLTIATVPSATSMTVSGTLANSYAGMKFCVSDPVDLPDKMLTALIRGIEFEIAKLKDRGAVQSAQQLYELERRRAAEADSVMMSPTFMDGGRGARRPPLRYYPITIPSLP